MAATAWFYSRSLRGRAVSPCVSPASRDKACCGSDALAVGPGKVGSVGISGGVSGGISTGCLSGLGTGSGEGGGTPGGSFGGVSGGAGGRAGSGLGLSGIGTGLFGSGSGSVMSVSLRRITWHDNHRAERWFPALRWAQSASGVEKWSGGSTFVAFTVSASTLCTPRITRTVQGGTACARS